MTYTTLYRTLRIGKYEPTRNRRSSP